MADNLMEKPKMTTAETTADEQQVRNFYVCPRCERKWQDVWSCACNDACPQCGCKDIEPLRSEPCEPGCDPNPFSTSTVDVRSCIPVLDTNPYVAVAKRNFASEGEIEIDDCTVISEGESGAYVMAWLYVSNEDLQAPS